MAKFIRVTQSGICVRVNVDHITYYRLDEEAQPPTLPIGSLITLLDSTTLLVRESPPQIDRLIDPTSTPHTS